MRERLNTILLSPFFLAAIISVIIIILLPPIVNKYELKLLDKGIVEKKDGVYYFQDLDKDGISEETIASPNINGEASIRIQSLDHALWDQWNFKGQYQGNPKLIFSDYDTNGKKEIFLTTLLKDSIFLHMLTPETGEDFYKEVFIDLVDTSKGTKDFSFGPAVATDFNNDKYEDILIFIFAGFTLQPRKLYIYDIKNDTLIKSQITGTNLRSDLQITDFNNDGYQEIFGGTPAPNNYNKPDIPYNDSVAWLMYFDHNLNFIFDPIPFYGRKPSLSIIKYEKDDKVNFLCLYRNRGKSNRKLELLLIDAKGKIKIRKKLAVKPEFSQSIRLIKHSDGGKNIIYLINGNTVYKVSISDKIFLKKYLDLNVSAINTLYQLDIDRDGVKEFITVSNKFHELNILDEDFKHPVKISIPDPNRKIVKIENILDEDNNKFFLQIGNEWFTYTYKKNALYKLRPVLHISLNPQVKNFVIQRYNIIG